MCCKFSPKQDIGQRFNYFIFGLAERKGTPSNVLATRRICGLLGAVNLINGMHLIVATHRICVGLINGQAVWQLAGYEFFPYIPTSLHLNEIQVSFSRDSELTNLCAY